MTAQAALLAESIRQSGSELPARASEFRQRQMEVEEENVIRSKESEEIKNTETCCMLSNDWGGREFVILDCNRAV